MSLTIQIVFLKELSESQQDSGFMKFNSFDLARHVFLEENDA